MANEVKDEEIVNAISVLMRVRQNLSAAMASIDGDEDDEMESATMIIEQRSMLKDAVAILQAVLDGNE